MQDIPALAASAAEKHPGVSYIVTAPIGLHELMVVRLHFWKMLKTRNTCFGNLPLLIPEAFMYEIKLCFMLEDDIAVGSLKFVSI